MLLERRIDLVRIPEILLGIIIEACQRANISDRMQHSSIDPKGYHEASKEYKCVSGE